MSKYDFVKHKVLNVKCDSACLSMICEQSLHEVLARILENSVSDLVHS
jgi:hypothetical protein